MSVGTAGAQFQTSVAAVVVEAVVAIVGGIGLFSESGEGAGEAGIQMTVEQGVVVRLQMAVEIFAYQLELFVAVDIAAAVVVWAEGQAAAVVVVVAVKEQIVFGVRNIVLRTASCCGGVCRKI